MRRTYQQRSTSLPLSALWRPLNVLSPPGQGRVPRIARQLQSLPKWLTGVFCHPAGTPGNKRMDRWREAGRLYTDVMLAAVALGTVQQPERRLRFWTTAAEKVAEQPGDEEGREETENLLFGSENVFDFRCPQTKVGISWMYLQPN